MPEAPALFIHNARIWTGDAAVPWVDAAVVRDRRFAFAGRAGDASPPAGCVRLDAEGRLVVPGLTDAHAHLLGTGGAMRSVDLKRTRSAAEAVARLAEPASRRRRRTRSAAPSAATSAGSRPASCSTRRSASWPPLHPRHRPRTASP